MSINNVEIQDSSGNIYYPHTDASVVKFGDSDVAASLSENTSDIAQVSRLNSFNTYNNFMIQNFNDINDFTSYDNLGNSVNGWTVSNNVVSSPSNSANNSDIFLKLNKSNICDGKLSVVIENPNTGITTYSYFGMFFRAKTQNDMLCATIHNDSKTVALFLIQNSTYTMLTNANIDLSQYVTGKPLVLDVYLYGNNIKVYVNGKKYIDFTGSSLNNYSGGLCGLLASSKTTEYSTKSFSNFTIQEKYFRQVPVTANKFLFMGDSITIGAYATSSFSTLMKNKLLALYNKNITTMNAGVGGYTTAQILANLDTYLDGVNQYDVVNILGGTNDSRIDLNIQLSDSINNLRQIIKKVKAYGSIPVICTTPPLAVDINTSTYSRISYDKLVHLNSMIKQLAISENIKCCDLFNAFNGDYTLLYSDKIHPIDAGQDLIANTLINTIYNQY